MAKGTAFNKTYSLNLGGNLYTIDSPKVMGILNLTTNSFYDGGKHNTLQNALKQTEKMLLEGATFIDVGANSTKPGAPMLVTKEEQNILLPILKNLIKEFPTAYFSIDTFNSDTALKSIELGAHIINDVSGGNLDTKMFTTIGKLKVPYVLMHMQGNPLTMQNNPQYTDVVEEVLLDLSNKVEQLHHLGVNDIILDPGFGFGKTLEHNYQLLNKLQRFSLLNQPILVGLSRKSMVYKLLGSNSMEALNGTTVANTLALLNGAQLLRVHDVKEAMEAIKIVHYAQNLN